MSDHAILDRIEGDQLSTQDIEKIEPAGGTRACACQWIAQALRRLRSCSEAFAMAFGFECGVS